MSNILTERLTSRLIRSAFTAAILALVTAVFGLTRTGTIFELEISCATIHYMSVSLRFSDKRDL